MLSLTPSSHLVRARQHAGHPPELRHPGHVPALRGRGVPVGAVHHPGGKDPMLPRLPGMCGVQGGGHPGSWDPHLAPLPQDPAMKVLPIGMVFPISHTSARKACPPRRPAAMALGEIQRLTDLDLPQQDPFSTHLIRVGGLKTGHPAPAGGVEHFLITGWPMPQGTSCSQSVGSTPARSLPASLGLLQSGLCNTAPMTLPFRSLLHEQKSTGRARACSPPQQSPPAEVQHCQVPG